ncbi:MAG: rod shape-determining protein MreC [Atopobiaceae bacterium]|nr:rod shape-determining protein MreC [Atopobiaceae bacterium]
MAKMPSMHSGRAKPSSSKLMRNETGGSAGILTVVLVALSLILFTFSVREGDRGILGAARGVVQTITSPIKVAGGYVVAPITGLGNIFRNLTADEQTLSELKQENEELRARNVELEEADQAARRLEELLDLRNTYSLQSIAARIIAGSSDSWVAAVTIDKGGTSGVTVGMPVTNAYGAVGQVISCAGTTSTVRLLTDESSSVAAMVQTSRAQGMAVGSPDGTLRLTLIRTDQAVNVGDVVVTSGLGGVFPKGLPVGKVTTVEKNPGSTYYDIVVEPFFRPETLEEVLVITSLTEEQQATSEDIVSADQPDLEAASGHAVGANAENAENGANAANNENGVSEGGDARDGGQAEGQANEQVTDENGTANANSTRTQRRTSATQGGDEDADGQNVYGEDVYGQNEYGTTNAMGGGLSDAG